MKVIILAGGQGTRLAEHTKTIPKPMVKILDKPILIHIMEHYYKFGFDEFYIALGYKGNIIRNYFKKNRFDWKVHLIETGKNSMTGGRLKRLKKTRKMTENQFKNITRSQTSDVIRKKKSDYVIYNNSTLKDYKIKINKLINKL